MSVSLYLRPVYSQGGEGYDVAPLRLVGELPNAELGEEYEGRLQIENSVGNCTVEQIGGADLPNGYRIFVDNDSKEVVIQWPEYAETTVPLFNGDFELGDVGWVAGAGWKIIPTSESQDVQHE